jgi:uncharacterized protein with GYD domain
MRALREKSKVELIEKMGSSVDEYPLEMALYDVSWYSQQGSVRQAIQSIQDSASTSLNDESDRVSAARMQLGQRRVGP